MWAQGGLVEDGFVSPAMRLLTVTAVLAVAHPASSEATCRTVTYTPPRTTPALHADLCAPAAGRAREAIVVVHGGGAVRGDRSKMRQFATMLRRRGAATLAIDYTLLGPDDTGPLYPRPERDVKLAVQWLRSQSAGVIADPRRIFVFGTSAGARIGAQALVTPNDPFFHAGAPTWNVSDRVAGFVGFAGPYSGRIVVPTTDTRYYGGPIDSVDPAVRERRRHADSAAGARRASGPALLFHGTQDVNVPIAESARFAAALRRAGKRVTFVRVPGADHHPTAAQKRSYARRVIAWLRTARPAGRGASARRTVR